MYVPHHFKEERPELLHGFIKEHPLGTLITQGEKGLSANLIPFFLESNPSTGNSSLFGHLARANPQIEELRSGDECLLVFRGENGYITPSWYQTKIDTGKVVPTWNYATVHVWGNPITYDDPDWLREHVETLTQIHETGRKEPWLVSSAPQDFIEKNLHAIVGVGISVARMEGKWKISQNRDAVDRNGVIIGLAEQNMELSEFMTDFFKPQTLGIKSEGDRL
jgi:transcriptional regulator